MKHLLSFILLLGAVTASAQHNIVESLQTKRAGEGTVTIHQSQQIATLIGQRHASGSTGTGTSAKQQTSSSKSIKGRGYRIQVYAGNNSRAAKSEAQAMGARVKEDFPELAVYTYFQSPRWLCRVGDFKSMEEAYAVMRKMKASGNNFKEASIVREQINIPIE